MLVEAGRDREGAEPPERLADAGGGNGIGLVKDAAGVDGPERSNRARSGPPVSQSPERFEQGIAGDLPVRPGNPGVGHRFSPLFRQVEALSRSSSLELETGKRPLADGWPGVSIEASFPSVRVLPHDTAAAGRDRPRGDRCTGVGSILARTGGRNRGPRHLGTARAAPRTRQKSFSAFILASPAFVSTESSLKSAASGDRKLKHDFPCILPLRPAEMPSRRSGNM